MLGPYKDRNVTRVIAYAEPLTATPSFLFEKAAQSKWRAMQESPLLLHGSRRRRCGMAQGTSLSWPRLSMPHPSPFSFTPWNLSTAPRPLTRTLRSSSRLLLATGAPGTQDVRLEPSHPGVAARGRAGRAPGHGGEQGVAGGGGQESRQVRERPSSRGGGQAGRQAGRRGGQGGLEGELGQTRGDGPPSFRSIASSPHATNQSIQNRGIFASGNYPEAEILYDKASE